tara:strand:- start:78 stop:350 length:273 start_codon:yes stop_codon:yes gene_type:complete
MPSDHISNKDYNNYIKSNPHIKTKALREDYESLREQKMHLQHRCSLYKTGLHNALEWLQEHTNLPEGTKDSHLAEKMVWDRLEIKKKELN